MTPTLGQFMRFLLDKVYQGQSLSLSDALLGEAFAQTAADARYYYDVSDQEVFRRVTTNQNELVVFLFRLGRLLFMQKPRQDDLLDALHWLMRSLCGCEVYFSNTIGQGFTIVHGLGTVIGSRNTIGQGFQIYQGCTIGHYKDFEDGCVIGDDVIMYAQSSVLGPVRIGDQAIIGAGCQVTSDLPAGVTCALEQPPRLHPRPPGA